MAMTLMQKARAKLLLQYVFWAGIIIPTPMIEDKTLPTAATNMKEIRYNPDFINSLKIEVVIFVLVHEAMHIMLLHGLRRGRRDPFLWNIACDFAINIQLKDWGFTLWEHCCVDEKYRGMHAEQIYELLPKKKKGGKGGKDGDEQGGFGGDLIEPEAMDQETRAKVEREIKNRISQAAQIAKMAGDMPEGLERLLDEFLNPNIPWHEELPELMTRICYEDETWRRRNRRILDYYLPTRYNEKAGEIVVIEDTSGSMGKDDLAMGAGVINSLKHQINPERIRVIWADASNCAHMDVIEEGDDLELHPKGGGGTDMRLPMKWAEQFDPRIVILFTDCGTPWPTVEPEYPLIVVSTTQEKCPWGRTLHVNTGR